MNQIEGFVDTKQAAQIMGVPTTTLKYWIKNRKLNLYYHPVTGFLMYKKEELEKMLEKRKEARGRKDNIASKR